MTKRTMQLRRRRRREPEWVEYTDEELLDLRICDLGVQVKGTELEARIEQLYRELENRGIRFRPHCWLSDEWFSPDDVPGIAIPFYLAHPRLQRLERKQMLDVEGGTKSSCMRILRHETGHALDTAYRLHRRRSWQQIFGKASQPYPEHYRPKPHSRNYVQHLEAWYAQAHPAEDFAETFAVWLKPNSRWRTEYEGWPALKKLEYVDNVMAEIAPLKPLVCSRAHVDSVRETRKTLREHYQAKRQRYEVDYPHYYDHDLLRLFSNSREHAGNLAAAVFLRRHRRRFCQDVAQWTGHYQYTVDQVLNDMIERCRQLRLRLRRSERQTLRDALVMITVQTMNYLHGGHHRVAV